MARALARLSVGRGGPRDLAALRAGIAAADARARAGWRAMPARCRPRSRRLRRRCAGRRARSLQNFARALADELPLLERDGGFVRAGYEPALDEARALRDEARRVVAALQARYAERDRRQGAEDPAQQRARLFRRGDGAARRQADVAAAERDLHPPPDPGRPGALHHRRAGRDSKRRSPTPPTARSAIELRDLREARARWRSRRPTNCMPRRRRSPRSMSPPRWPKLASDAGLRAARGRRVARLRDRRRPASGGRAGAGARRRSPSSPTTAICRRAQARSRAASGSSPVRTWPANRPSCARTR